MGLQIDLDFYTARMLRAYVSRKKRLAAAFGSGQFTQPCDWKRSISLQERMIFD